MEDQRVPRDTGGGPDGVVSPVRDGEDICQDLVRSRVRKSLSNEVSSVASITNKFDLDTTLAHQGLFASMEKLTPFIGSLASRSGGSSAIIV